MEPLDAHGGVVDGRQRRLQVRRLALVQRQVAQRPAERRFVGDGRVHFVSAPVLGVALQILDLVQRRLVVGVQDQARARHHVDVQRRRARAQLVGRLHRVLARVFGVHRQNVQRRKAEIVHRPETVTRRQSLTVVEPLHLLFSNKKTNDSIAYSFMMVKPIKGIHRESCIQ